MSTRRLKHHASFEPGLEGVPFSEHGSSSGSPPHAGESPPIPPVLSRLWSASAPASFERVIYGEIGQCVAHCLHVHELATFSRVSKEMVRMGQWKFAHFRSLDLTLYPMMSHRHFELLCGSVLGVEALLFDIAGLAPRALLQGDVVNSAPSDQWESSGGAPSIDWKEYERFSIAILALVERNAATLKLIQVKQRDFTQRSSVAFKEYQSHCLMPLFRRAVTLPNLESFHVPSVLRWDVFFSLAPQFALASNSLRRNHATSSQWSLVSRSLPSGFFPRLKVLSGIVYPTLYLHRILPHLSGGMESLRLCFPWHQQAGAEVSEHTVICACACSSIFCRSRYILLCFVITPQEQARHIRELSEPTPQDRYDTYLEEEEQPDGAAALSRVLSVDRLNRVLGHFQSLQYLSLQLYEAYLPQSVIVINLPHLLQLTIDCDVDAHLSDVSFILPSLQTLHLSCEFICPPEEAARKVQERLEQGIGEEEEEMMDTPMYIIPPTLLTSLSHSPSLRFLCLPLCSDTAEDCIPNLADTLGEQTKKIIYERARRLDRPCPFDEGGSRIRLLLYALSTLPFAEGLNLFEDNSPSVPMLELFQLFPSLGSYSSDPDFIEPGAPFFRPSGYQLETSHLAQKILAQKSHTWDRLRVPASEEEDGEQVRGHGVSSAAASYHDRTRHYFSLAHKDARMSMDDLHPLILNRFSGLSILYLSAPSKVDSDAVHTLLARCHSLSSLSLIQLVGIDDDVFYFPGTWSMMSLKTLKLKNPCQSQLDHSGVGALTPITVDRCAALFPQLENLELLNFPCSAEVLKGVAKHLDGGAWKEMTCLTLPSSAVVEGHEETTADALAELRAAWSTRVALQSQSPSVCTNQNFILQLVEITEPVRDVEFADDGHWFLHRRKLLSIQSLQLDGPARAVQTERMFREASCYADCCQHEPVPQVPDAENGVAFVDAFDAVPDAADNLPPDYDAVPLQAIVALPSFSEDDFVGEEEEESQSDDGEERKQFDTESWVEQEDANARRRKEDGLEERKEEQWNTNTE